MTDKPAFSPRGLSRIEAAAYVGVSPNTFESMVKDGRMPRPKVVNRRRIWDRAGLDRCFDALPDTSGRPSPKPVDWTDVAV